MELVDPGSPPPRGIVVRAEPEGFYARLYPAPHPPLAAVGIGAVVSGLFGVGLALVMTETPEVRVWIVLASVSLVGLIGAFRFGAGFIPIEVRGDHAGLTFAGDRIPWSMVSGGAWHDGTLTVRGASGGVLAQAVHLRPDVARWVAQAIDASVQLEAEE